MLRTQMLLKFVSAILFAFLLPAYSHADVVAVGFSSTTFASVDGISDTDNSNNNPMTLASNANGDEAFTESMLDWSFADDCLDANGLVTAKRDTETKTASEHSGTSSFLIKFEIDSEMEISICGDWGFSGNTEDGGDGLRFQLRDETSAIYSDSTTSNTGIASDTFEHTSILGPGTYTWEIRVALTESLTEPQIAQAGWALSKFKLSNVAVPEPTGLLVLGLGGIAMITRRRR